MHWLLGRCPSAGPSTAPLGGCGSLWSHSPSGAHTDGVSSETQTEWAQGRKSPACLDLSALTGSVWSVLVCIVLLSGKKRGCKSKPIHAKGLRHQESKLLSLRGLQGTVAKPIRDIYNPRLDTQGVKWAKERWQQCTDELNGSLLDKYILTIDRHYIGSSCAFQFFQF